MSNDDKCSVSVIDYIAIDIAIANYVDRLEVESDMSQNLYISN